MSSRLCAISFIAWCCVSLAAMPPPDSQFSESLNSTLSHKASTALLLGPARFEFEEATLAQVQEVLGAGQIEHWGDAGESVYWLCYSNRIEGGVETFWLVASGEMGGPEHRIGRVSAVLAQAAPPECPDIAPRFQPVRLDTGLWLGVQGDAVKRLGRPSNASGPWRGYAFHGRIPGKCPGAFDLLSWVQIKVEDKLISELHAGRVTSC